MVKLAKENVTCLLGNDTSINFWLDNWLSIPIVDMLHIHVSMDKYMKSKVSDYISDSFCSIPAE